MVRALVSGEMREFFPTVLADAKDGAVAMPLLINDERLIVTHPIGSTPVDIAAVTGHNQVTQIVIAPVTVEMIDDQRSMPRAISGQPVNERVAPVARMRSFANRVKQHGAMLVQSASVVREWMRRERHPDVVAGLLFLRFPFECRVAGAATEMHLIALRVPVWTLNLCAAMGAGYKNHGESPFALHHSRFTERLH